MTASPDLDLLVLGGGSAGLTAAVLGAGLGAQVGLIEQGAPGGDCLWTGCVPSKALIASASVAHRMRHADRWGVEPAEPSVDLSRVWHHVRGAQAHIEPHDSPDRLRGLGVAVHQDDAGFVGPRRVRLAGGDTLTARTLLVATGSEPVLPPVDGLAAIEPATTDTVWALERLPQRLVVLGGGPVGCELAQAFARLGSHVTLVEMAERLLPREDPEASALIAERFAAEGIDVRTGSGAARAEGWPGDGRLTVTGAAGEHQVPFDTVLAATGRRPRTDGLGLDRAGVRTDAAGAVPVTSRLRTSARGVYAAGDVTGVLPFTHVAGYQAAIAALNALFAPVRTADYHSVPWVTFTDPEVAHVGWTEGRARQRWGDDTAVARIDYDRVDRAVTAGEPHGFAKLVGDPRGRMVGATVAAPAGGEVIAELAGAISRKAKIGEVFRTVHPYPTFALGAVSAGSERMREQWFTERTRRVTRPVLSGLRRASAITTHRR